MKDSTVWLTTAAAILLMIATPTSAQDGNAHPTEMRGPEHSAPVTPFVFMGDVRDLPRPVPWQPGDPVKEIPRRRYPKPGQDFGRVAANQGIDRLLGRQSAVVPKGTGQFTIPDRNFPGVGYTGVNPPDTVGDVGPAHYIQMVNDGGGAIVRIFDKAIPTPALLAEFQLDSLGSSSCGSGYGDPVALWDRFAERWMLSEFSSGGNNLCLYISQTTDPVSGGWYNYQFTTPQFPDYPKYGVWPTDANGGTGSYIVTTNESGCAVYAMDRAAMLTGAAATFQRFLISDLPGFPFNAVTPADIDGPEAPPTGAPAVIMRQRDTEAHGGPSAPEDVLEIWHYHVDWTTPANSTLTQLPNIDVAEFESDLCGLSAFACFQQPGTGTTLDPLREVIMNRLQYQNFDDRESLVGNFVTDVDGTDHGGLRWFELRRTGGTGSSWTLFQEGTYSPDTDNRWMAASAMDQSGNIAIAYNVSSTSTFPSLRYTGRLSDDPPGTMSQPESSIFAGTASNSSNRYGDYSAMNLDPVDDCTFWFTGEYNVSSNWSTRIASFKFDACGCLLEPSQLAVTAQDVGPNQIEIGWNDADLETVIEYTIGRSRTQGGPYDLIATIPDTSPGVAGGPDYFYLDTDVSGGTTYYYIVRGSDGGACTSDQSNEAAETASGACTLPPEFDGLQSVTTPYFATCTLDLAWNPALSNCGGGLSYSVYRSTTPGFAPDQNSLIAEQIFGTSFSDFDQLDTGTPYYYIVRARDEVIAVEDGNLVELAAIPLGPLTQGTWNDDAGDTGTAKMLPTSPWSVNGTEGNFGPNVYKTGSYPDDICAGLTTPEMLLGVGSQLTFWSRYAIENSWDKGEVQVSVDGGQSWSRVPMSYPGSSDDTSDECGLPTGSYFTGTDNSWNEFTADLSAWGGMNVMLRFVLSTDGSVNGAGWWIDDISITQVDVPGDCTTGTACADNPSVNVTPEGPMTVCGFDQPVLSAELTGGNGPFQYQWTQDGEDVPGATGATYQPTAAGTHAYNVRVKADVCDGAVTDNDETVFTTQDQPEFGGLTSVTNAQQSVCTIDITWDPGSSLCAGPVQYFVYRDTGSPVDPVPANLVAPGVGGTSYADSSGLVAGTTYHYLVQAQDATSGIFDGNTVEGSATPDGPGTGVTTQFAEGFGDPASFDDWTVTVGPDHDCGEWVRSISAAERPSGSFGFYALASNQCGVLFGQTSTILTSPAIDLDLTGLLSVTLEYDLYHNYNNGDDASVEVWDGSNWVVIWSDSNTDVNEHQQFDVTAQAAGNPNFQVRFSYQNAQGDRWFSVEDVEIVTERFVECALASGLLPAPDGRLGTTPMRGSRLSAAGDVIQATWDVTSCPSLDYNLVYGDLAGVASYTLDGGQCSIGTAGSFDWNGVPAGDLFFLIVGTDGAGAESSWGFDSDGGERNGTAASGECAVTAKDTAGTCP